MSMVESDTRRRPSVPGNPRAALHGTDFFPDQEAKPVPVSRMRLFQEVDGSRGTPMFEKANRAVVAAFGFPDTRRPGSRL
jgi:hypothetical protein